LIDLATLLTLGGLLENRKEWVFLESARLVVFGLAVYLHGGWFGSLITPAAVIGLEAFALGSLAWLWLASSLEGSRVTLEDPAIVGRSPSR